VYDDGPNLGWQLAAADVAITDVSAMVYDRLATGKPLLIARPVSESAEIDENGYLGNAEWLHAEDAHEVLDIIERVRTSEEAQRRLEFWVERHFGDTTPGVTTTRFHAAVEQLVAEWHRHAALHLGEKRVRESDPFDADADQEDDAPNVD
jgi:CDP-glycerol glycerophosphotransferase (TagB/SpsB family)